MKKSSIPYIIIGVFVAFAAFIISIVVQSMHQDVNLVSKDYYAEELAYENQIQEQTISKPFQSQVKVSQLENEKMMRIELPKSLEKLEGKMVLYRPSSSKLDIDIPLNMNQHNEQYIRTEKMMKGVWLVKIYVKSANKNYYFERQIII